MRVWLIEAIVYPGSLLFFAASGESKSWIGAFPPLRTAMKEIGPIPNYRLQSHRRLVWLLPFIAFQVGNSKEMVQGKIAQ